MNWFKVAAIALGLWALYKATIGIMRDTRFLTDESVLKTSENMSQSTKNLVIAYTLFRPVLSAIAIGLIALASAVLSLNNKW